MVAIFFCGVFVGIFFAFVVFALFSVGKPSD